MVREMNPTVACQPMHGFAVLPKYEVRVSTDPPEIIPSEYGTHKVPLKVLRRVSSSGGST